MSNPNSDLSLGKSRNLTGLDNTGPSADQLHVAAMNQGCTEEGAKMVVEILQENPYLDSEATIKEVAGGKTSDKDEVVAKVTKETEAKDKKAAESDTTKVVDTKPKPK